MSGKDESGLGQFEEGDEIAVSERSTPMTVTRVKKTRSGKGVKMLAENRHGKYELIQFGDEPPTLRAGGDKRLIGPVEVQYAE